MFFTYSVISIFFISFIIQLIFLTIFSKISFYKSKHSELTCNEPVSIIVCAHNEWGNLKALIPLLLNQTYATFEIIIVNDRSTDESSILLEKFAKKYSNFNYLNIQCIPKRVNPKKYALTLGIKAAQHDIILLTDADCRPSSNVWISHMAGKFHKEKCIVLGYSPYQKTKGILNKFIQYETLLTGLQYLSAAIIGFPYMGIGRNLAYRKSFFMKKKGLEPFLDITGGDDDLFVNRNANKKNTTYCIEQKSFVTSIPKKTIKDYLIQKRRHVSVGKHYTITSRIYIACFMLSHSLFWFCFFILLFFKPYLVLISFIIRIAIWSIVVRKASQKLGNSIHSFSIILLDLAYTFYIILSGISSFFSRKITWS